MASNRDRDRDRDRNPAKSRSQSAQSKPLTDISEPSSSRLEQAPVAAAVPMPAVEPPSPLTVDETSAPATSPAPSPTPSFGLDPAIIEKLKRLTPDQRAKIRSMREGDGEAPGSRVRKLADGSLEVPIVVNVDIVEAIRTWAEEAGKSFEDQVRELVDYLLQAYLVGGMFSPEPLMATQATPPAATPVK